jgi:hypothetical protein
MLKIDIYKIMKRGGQLFFSARVLMGVVSKCRAISSHGSGFNYPQQENSPTTNVRPPQYRGPSILLGSFWLSAKADFAVEGHGSGTVNDQHDRNCE